mgnify:CR=1 FL=1
MMTLLREALSWNYVLVTAVISSLLAQFTKVILNLIILGKFIPERLWGAGGNGMCAVGCHRALLRHRLHGVCPGAGFGHYCNV